MCGSRLSRTLHSSIWPRAQGAWGTYRSILGGCIPKDTFGSSHLRTPRHHQSHDDRRLLHRLWLASAIAEKAHSRACSAIEQFRTDLSNDPELLAQLWTLSRLRLVCHCAPSHSCHGDMIIQKFPELHPDAYDRSQPSATPDALTLDCLAALREEPPSDQGSSPDEDALPAGSSWTGSGSHMMIGTGVHLPRSP